MDRPVPKIIDISLCAINVSPLRRDSSQNVLHKTQHSVYYVVHGKLPHHEQGVAFLIIFRKMMVDAVEGLHSTAL